MSSNFNVTASSKGSSSKLFSSVSMCPPIAPKTMISPNLDPQKLGRGGYHESSSSRKQSTDGNQADNEKGTAQPFNYFTRVTKHTAASNSPIKRLEKR